MFVPVSVFLRAAPSEDIWQYTSKTDKGPLALTITASISLLSVLIIFGILIISEHRSHFKFIRSSVGPFFISLLLSDLLQAIGSMMNIKWMLIMKVEPGHFCTAQAGLKQTGNLGTAVWSLAIAFHTFLLLFLRRPLKRPLSCVIFFVGWIFIAFIIILGPLILEKDAKGPFWGVSGFWCWITNDYHIEQFTNEYLYMFITVGLSFVLYTLIFLRLRGNIRGYGWDLRLGHARQPWTEEDMVDEEISSLGKQILWYPIGYSIIVLPIAICRWSDIFGHKVPFWATFLSDSIFVLSGFVNAILFTITRRLIIIPTPTALTRLLRESMAGTKGGFSSRDSLPEMNFSNPSPNPYWAEYQRRQSLKSTQTPREPRRASEFQRHQFVDTSALFAQRGQTSTIVTPFSTFPSHPQAPFDHPSPSLPSSSTDIRSSIIMHPFANPDAYQSRLTPVDQSPIQSASVSPITSLSSSPEPPRRKRFSGWSFPSIRGGLAVETETLPHERSAVVESDFSTSMEEMHFAPPSPQQTQPPTQVRKVSTAFWV